MTFPMFLLLLTVSIVFLLGFIWYLVYENKMQQLVLTTSTRLHALIELNGKYTFYDVPEMVTRRWQLDTKPKYDHFNFEKNVFMQVSKEREEFETLLQLTRENANLMNQYLHDFDNLPPYFDETEDYEPTWRSKMYARLERDEVKKEERNCPTPTTELLLRCAKTYTSPQGRRNYGDSQVYTASEIETLINESYQKDKEKESKEYQRKAMTPSLRYDIMKRDGFKCVLCGRTPKNGITLHVDHILPVSKGGKTVPPNLRTLCSICNLGKSDKYDENGLN